MAKLLTFEYDKASGVLNIHTNREGAQEMIEIFQRLLRCGLNEARSPDDAKLERNRVDRE